jgi:hypothetical protein
MDTMLMELCNGMVRSSHALYPLTRVELSHVIDGRLDPYGLRLAMATLVRCEMAVGMNAQPARSFPPSLLDFC